MRTASPSTVCQYACGLLPRIPKTAVQVYGEVLDPRPVLRLAVEVGIRPVAPFAKLQRSSWAWDGVGESPSESVRKPTTIESGLGLGWAIV